MCIAVLFATRQQKCTNCRCCPAQCHIIPARSQEHVPVMVVSFSCSHSPGMLLCARFTRKFRPSMTSMGWRQQQQHSARLRVTDGNRLHSNACTAATSNALASSALAATRRTSVTAATCMQGAGQDTASAHNPLPTATFARTKVATTYGAAACAHLWEGCGARHVILPVCCKACVCWHRHIAGARGCSRQ